MQIEEIAAVSMGMRMAETATAVDIAVTKKAMEMEQMIAEQMLESLEAAIPTHLASFGQKLDVLA